MVAFSPSLVSWRASAKAALHDVGYWSSGMLTEDIDVSWSLQIPALGRAFEPKGAMLDPRARDATRTMAAAVALVDGGIQVLIKNWRIAHIWKARRMWPVLMEYVMSVAWAYAMLVIAILWLAGLFIELPPEYRITSLLRDGTVSW